MGAAEGGEGDEIGLASMAIHEVPICRSHCIQDTPPPDPSISPAMMQKFGEIIKPEAFKRYPNMVLKWYKYGNYVHKNLNMHS